MDIKTQLFLLTCTFSPLVFANDSTGYVGTGGIQYLKNKNIAMQSEDLFISKKLIKVDYLYKNLSANDVEETVVFPLPAVESFIDSDFARTDTLIKSFKIVANGQNVAYQTHVRAFMQPLKKSGETDWDAKALDVTNAMKECGLSDQELQSPWTQKIDRQLINKKIFNCQNPQIKSLLKGTQYEDEINWSGQVIYSWKQKFKANSITRIQHQYKPLVGGSVALFDTDENKVFCMDQQFKQGLKKSNAEHAPYSALSYILTTGANWAKPIENFKLTVERDPGELVSFCWKGKVTKLSPTRFQMVEKNFVPKQDIDIIFVPVKH
ncbi:DUF4424 family protein [Acinetobacter gerneri]|uniref:DUF4424 family protein n=1 Tax=Acinetobacter gerneri TaxID=202952 RepID=UPI003A870444